MSTPSAMSALPKARVTEGAFLGVLWAGVGVSLCFVAFRLFVKIKSFRRLYADDCLVIAAWAMLLATAITWQIETPTLYEQYAIQAGEKKPDLGFVDRDTSFFRTIVPFNILFYTSLWTVKLSFLIFFRRLGSKVRGHKIWWWVILVVTILTWVACIADIHYKCSLDSYITISTYCPSLPSVQYENRTFYANCAADVITDCLILSIPVLMLWNVRVALRQKLALLGLFSLTVVVMIVSIIRVAVVNSTKRNADISWLYVWSNIEVATSIIIACLASFRQLFVKNHHQRQDGKLDASSSSRKGLLSYFRSMGKSSTKINSHPKWPSFRSKSQNSEPKSDSQTHIVPLDSIHVGHTIDISNTKLAS